MWLFFFFVVASRRLLTDSSSALSRFVYATISFLLRFESCASTTLVLGRFVPILLINFIKNSKRADFLPQKQNASAANFLEI